MQGARAATRRGRAVGSPSRLQAPIWHSRSEQSLPPNPGKHTQSENMLHSPRWLHELGHAARATAARAAASRRPWREQSILQRNFCKQSPVHHMAAPPDLHGKTIIVNQRVPALGVTCSNRGRLLRLAEAVDVTERIECVRGARSLRSPVCSMCCPLPGVSRPWVRAGDVTPARTCLS
jgi:hypothetical protein